MLCVPVPIALGVYVDVHVAALPALRVHAVNVPVPLLAGVIVPPAALLLPLSVSVTVTVQVLESFTGIELGAQLTPVVVVRVRTVSAKAVAVLPPACIESAAAKSGVGLGKAVPVGRRGIMNKQYNGVLVDMVD